VPEMIVAITLLLAGLVLPVSVWARGGGPADAPPIDAVGQVREVNGSKSDSSSPMARSIGERRAAARRARRRR
jgi:hypothetical protein